MFHQFQKSEKGIHFFLKVVNYYQKYVCSYKQTVFTSIFKNCALLNKCVHNYTMCVHFNKTAVTFTRTWFPFPNIGKIWNNWTIRYAVTNGRHKTTHHNQTIYNDLVMSLNINITFITDNKHVGETCGENMWE